MQELFARKNHAREYCAHVAFQKVAAQPRDVAHVVADVIGDYGGVAGVVLGYVSLGFADQIGAHIGSFCVNSAAHAVEQGDNRTAERIAREGHRKPCRKPQPVLFLHVRDNVVNLPERHAEHEIYNERADKREARHAQSHHRAAL